MVVNIKLIVELRLKIRVKVQHLTAMGSDSQNIV